MAETRTSPRSIRPPTAAQGYRFSLGPTTSEPFLLLTAPDGVPVTRTATPAEQFLKDGRESASGFLDVIVVSPERSAQRGRVLEWVGAGKREPASFGLGDTRFRLGEYRAAIFTDDRDVDETLAGLVAYRVLRTAVDEFEVELRPVETGAAGDVPHAYRIGLSSRSRWSRFGDTIEILYRLRVRFAALENALAVSADLSKRRSRRVFDKAVSADRLEDRLQSLGDRLEVCEDLYEGATDRVTDYKWFLGSFVAEVVIVVLLAAEALLLLTQQHH